VKPVLRKFEEKLCLQLNRSNGKETESSNIYTTKHVYAALTIYTQWKCFLMRVGVNRTSRVKAVPNVKKVRVNIEPVAGTVKKVAKVIPSFAHSELKREIASEAKTPHSISYPTTEVLERAQKARPTS